MNIKAVIFDLDGVIVSTDDCHYEAWKKMADEEGIYLEAGDMVIDIREDYEVEYDEYEEMYIITCQDGTKYYFTDVA